MIVDASDSQRLTSQLRQYLRPGEELLWFGKPDPSVIFTAADAGLIPFSLLWLAFAIFWEAGVVRSGVVFAELWGIPFVALGIYIVAGRFIVKRIRKARTAYGVTPDRAMVAIGRSFADTPLQGVPMSVRRSRDGRHVSITFDGPIADAAARMGYWSLRRQRSYGMYANTGLEPLMRGAQMSVGFYDVADPDMLLSAVNRARQGGTW